MPLWNVFPRGNHQSLLGIVNERSFTQAQAAAEARYGRVRQHLGPMIDRPVMVELGETQILILSAGEVQ